MKEYPITATERFDKANFHIKYTLSFLKKFIHGDILEIGAGCGSFTKNYFNNNVRNILLTDLDKSNILSLKKRFKNYKNIKVSSLQTIKINKKFDTILYFHVLEHIKNDVKELREAKKKLKKNGTIIIVVPAHQDIYSNLDKAVGHYRRYSRNFFKKNLCGMKRLNLKSIDVIGYWLYSLNRIFFKTEVFPSKLKIFIWDKLFTPVTILFDWILNYKFGKCILTIYKKN